MVLPDSAPPPPEVPDFDKANEREVTAVSAYAREAFHYYKTREVGLEGFRNVAVKCQVIFPNLFLVDVYSVEL